MTSVDIQRGQLAECLPSMSAQLASVGYYIRPCDNTLCSDGKKHATRIQISPGFLNSHNAKDVHMRSEMDKGVDETKCSLRRRSPGYLRLYNNAMPGQTHGF
jgi:hypothetical protein